MFHRARLWVIMILAVTMANSEATLIDNFLPADNNFSLTYGPGQPAGSNVAVTEGPMVSGERDVEIVQTTSRDPAVGATFFVRYEPHRWYNDEKFYYISGIGPGPSFRGEDAVVRLQYDGTGDEEGNIGLGRRLTNSGAGNSLFEPTDGGIRLWASAPDASRLIPTTVVLRREGVVIGSSSQNVGDTDFFQPYFFPFAPAVFGEADSLTLEFSLFARGGALPNLFISHIDTIVPEGESGMAFAAGVWALAAGHRGWPGREPKSKSKWVPWVPRSVLKGRGGNPCLDDQHVM